MKAASALQAALENGGWNLGQDAGIGEREIRDYFTEDNFRSMFPGEDATECGGFSLDECAQAVIDWQNEADRG